MRMGKIVSNLIGNKMFNLISMPRGGEKRGSERRYISMKIENQIFYPANYIFQNIICPGRGIR